MDPRSGEELAGIFGVDFLGFAIMGNHLHVILRNRPNVVETWSDEEVATRWWRLFPKRREEDGRPAQPTEYDLKMILGTAKDCQEKRRRLSDISWVMRCLAEVIARRANKEDQCTGRFWEGRFKAQKLIDDLAGVTTHVAHDAAGNMTKVPKPTSWTAHYDLKYDAWNRLTEVKDGASTVATYEYDGLNRRIVKNGGQRRRALLLQH